MIRRFAFACLHALSYFIWIAHPIILFFSLWVIALVVPFIPKVLNLQIHPTWIIHKDLKEQILLWYLKKA